MKLGYERIVNRNSLSLHFPANLFHNERLLYLIQTLLHCRYAVDSCCDMDSKRSSLILAHAVLRRRLRASQAMSIVRCKRRRVLCLLRSYMIERRTIRRKTQTSNAIFSHYNLLLLCNDYCHTKRRPSTRVESTFPT